MTQNDRVEDKRFATLHELVATARHNLDQTTWDYVIGGSDSETTVRRNRSAIDSLGWVPRVLNDVSRVDPSTYFLDSKLSIPVLLAPIGSLQVIEEGGGASAAKAAAESGVMSIASSVCEPSLESIAAASDAPKIYQLYVRGNDNWVAKMVERSIAAGYKGFCLTVDTAVVSRRERDIAKRVIPTSQQSSDGINYQASLSWTTVDMIKAKFDIPLIIKGLAHIDDVQRALDCGVDVIYVSNHGGRQLDQGVGTIALLPEIATLVDGRAAIAIDGGFYRGNDIVKAIALGADAVGIGRLEAWSLAAGGVPALNRCLSLLSQEIKRSMALLGVTSLDQLNPTYIRETQRVSDSNILSAFPLIDDYPTLSH